MTLKKLRVKFSPLESRGNKTHASFVAFHASTLIGVTAPPVCAVLPFSSFCPRSLRRTMQDLENPQVTSCNKGDQHYRSSPSNQSSSSDPGPCGSSGWSQQPGYDGYGTTPAALLFSPTYSFFFLFWSRVPLRICFFRVMNAAPISGQALAATRNFAKWQQFFFPYKMTKIISALFFLSIFATFFSSRKIYDKGIQFCSSQSHTTFWERGNSLKRRMICFLCSIIVLLSHR